MIDTETPTEIDEGDLRAGDRIACDDGALVCIVNRVEPCDMSDELVDYHLADVDSDETYHLCQEDLRADDFELLERETDE